MSISKLGKLFLDQSKLKNLAPINPEGAKQPLLELPDEENSERINLTLPEKLNFGRNANFKQLLDQRRTLRKYGSKALTLDELAFLLWSTQGVQKKTETTTLRIVPSAGARHAFETFLLVNNVEGLTPGLYHYRALDHQVVAVNLSEGIRSQLIEASRQKFINDAPVAFLWIAVTERMTWRYGDRGYRYLFLDAGHVCQNLYLSAESINCGACAIDAFYDDEMNQLLGLNGEDQFLIYMASVGKKA